MAYSKEHKRLFAEEVIGLVSNPRYPFASADAATKIANAKRFVLTDDFLDAAISLIRTRPESLIDLTHTARLPFPLMWIEYSGKRRYYANDPQFPCTEEEKPERCGYLLEATNNTLLEGTASLFQGSFRPELGMFFSATSMFMWSFDYGPKPNPEHYLQDCMISNALFQAIRQAEIENCKRWLDSQGKNVTTEQIEELFKRDIRLPCPYSVKWLQNIERARLEDSEEFARFAAINISTMRGDNFLLRAILALINSQKNVQYEDVRYDPIVMRHRQRKGRQAWLDHSVIKFGFSDHQVKRMKAAGMTDAEIRAHFVKGHWKVRKTGVFWWNPHLRGSLSDGFVDSIYEGV